MKSIESDISTSILSFKKMISKKDERISKEMEKSRKYYNEIQELRGNIRVYCRIKPSLKLNNNNNNTITNNTKCVCSSDYSTVNLCSKKTNVIKNKDNNNLLIYDYTYEYDYVFSENSKQEEVFEEVKPLVMLSLDGYNSCIFAYGETGSGKTYTMEGYENNYGIIYRTFEVLFNEKKIKEENNDNKIKIKYRMYMVEIYNETVRDLLNDLKPLEIHQNSDGSVYLKDVMKKEINNYDEVINIMKMGNKNRSTNSTNSNEHSSRSHMLLFIEIETINKYINNKIKISNLTLIDLAGSERVSKSGVSGDRLKEAQNINKSLSCLGDVIESLQQKQQHIPYRNSKLTYLLKNNLCKDNKVLMLVMINNDFSDVNETKCSLTFASRVRSVELGSSKDYKSVKEIKELKEEILMLRRYVKEIDNNKMMKKCESEDCESEKCESKEIE